MPRIQLFLGFCLVIAISLMLYYSTVSRSVYFGDSGEFIAVAKTQGIAHPPGYPLYSFLVWLISLIPTGDLTLQVNAFSSLTSAITAGIFFILIFIIARDLVIAFFTALILTVSYSFWLYALVAEVFSLHALLFTLCILLFVSLFFHWSRWLFYSACFIFGLALTNHHTIVFLVPALFVYYLIEHRQFEFSILIKGAIFLVLGTLPYIYLPLRALANPLLNWGDPDSLSRFIHIVTRGDYGTFALSSGGKGINWEGLRFYFTWMQQNFSVTGILLALIGFYSTFKRNSGMGIFIVTAFLFSGPVFVLLTGDSFLPLHSHAAIERFFIASFILVAAWVGFGANYLSETLSRKGGIAILAFIFGFQLISNYPKVNQKTNDLNEQFGRELFASLPENAVLFTFTDKLSMVSTFLQHVEEERPDIKIIKFTFLTDQWYADSLKRMYPDFQFPYEKYVGAKLTEYEAAKIICNQVIEKYPVFIERESSGFNLNATPDCAYEPYRLVVRMIKPVEALTDIRLEDEKKWWLDRLDTLAGVKPYDLRTQVVKYHYAESLSSLITKYIEMGEFDISMELIEKQQAISDQYAQAFIHLAEIYNRQKEYSHAVTVLEQAIKIQPRMAIFYKQLANLYLKLEKKDAAILNLQKYAELLPQTREKSEVLKTLKQLKGL